MDYITVNEAGARWRVTSRMANYYWENYGSIKKRQLVADSIRCGKTKPMGEQII